MKKNEEKSANLKLLKAYRGLIVLLGLVSIILLLFSKVYKYQEFTMKSFGTGMRIGVILWVLFMLNAMILTFMNNKQDDKFEKIRNIVRNLVLIILVSLLVFYKLGNLFFKLYEMDGSVYNGIIYAIFGVVFIIYVIIAIYLNLKEQKSSKKIKK